MLGYSARLAYGCNIGAYFSGIASGSLHGWVWMAAAFFGNVLGTRLRPAFGLEVERLPRQTCRAPPPASRLSAGRARDSAPVPPG